MGRYPYLERQGVRTLRAVCPYDTPGFKELMHDATPQVGWWIDLAAQLAIPWAGPPDGLDATKALGADATLAEYEACGRARLFAQVEGAAITDLVGALARGERVLWLDEWSGPSFRVDAGVPVAPTVDRPGVLTFEFDAPRAGWLFVSEKWFPGWTAQVDGASARVESANLAFLAVEVPAGHHVVTLAYRPRWAWIALPLSALGLVAALVVVVRPARPR
jgi:hypothetical protein